MNFKQKPFNDIPENCAIKIGGLFVVNFKDYSSKLFNGDQEIGVSNIYYVDSIDNLFTKKHDSKEIDFFQNPNGDKHTPEEIKQLQEKFSVYWDDDAEDYVYPDEESEIEGIKAKRYIRDFRAVYKDVIHELETYRPELIGEAVDTGSGFIQSAWVSGKAYFDTNGSLFKVDGAAVAMDEFCRMKNQHDHIEFDLPTHSHLEYAKFDGAYIFTGKKNNPVINGKYAVKMFCNLDDAKEYENSCRKIVSNVINMNINKSKIDKATADQLHGIVENAKARMISCKETRKGESDKRQAIKYLNEVLEILEGI